MILLLSLVGRVVSGCLLPTVTLVRGTFTTGSAKPGNKQCPRIFFVSSDLSCLGEEFCRQHPKWSWETHPQEKELLTGTYFISFWRPLTQALCAIWFPKVKRRTKDQCSACSSWSDPDGVSFLCIQVIVRAMENGMCFGICLSWWKTAYIQEDGAFLLASV